MRHGGRIRLKQLDESSVRCTKSDCPVAPAGCFESALAPYPDDSRPPGGSHLHMNRLLAPKVFAIVVLLGIGAGLCSAAGTPAKRRRHHVVTTHATAATAKVATVRTASVSVPAASVRKAVPTQKLADEVIIRGGPWTEPTYADSTKGDNVDGEDLVIRRAAVEDLGDFNGSVVVVDPSNGRVLSIVNQHVALSTGFQPCSTIKVSVALSGLSEKVIHPENKLRLAGLGKMDLTYALAHSNNYYFATLGEKLGFEKVSYTPICSAMEKRPA